MPLLFSIHVCIIILMNTHTILVFFYRNDYPQHMFLWKSIPQLSANTRLTCSSASSLYSVTETITYIMSYGRRDNRLDSKVYVGELGYGAAKQELEDIFSRYGPLRSVWVARNPPGFAFVEFEDERDVDDACRELDGT